MNLTSLGLQKPITTEAYDINVHNYNSDLLNSLIVAAQSDIASGQRHKLTANDGKGVRAATNCNSEIVSGFYTISTSATNGPTAATAGLLWVATKDGSVIYQVMFYSASNTIYTRYSGDNGATWSAWVSMATTTQLASKLESTLYTAADVLTKVKTVDGSGSGLDSDLLDAQEGAYYLSRANHTGTMSADAIIDGTTNKAFTASEKTKLAGIESGATADQTAGEILTAIKTVDGIGSGLDADLLDGLGAAAFALVGHVHADLVAAIDGKQPTITGAATTITDADLAASKALVSSASGKVAVASVTAIELAYLVGVTSGIQAQLNGKQPTITGAASTIALSDLTASRVVVSDPAGKVVASSLTTIELAYLSGVTSGIQAQLNGKQPTITGAASSIAAADLPLSKALVSDGSGKVAAASVTAVELAYLVGVTSGIQAQLNGKQPTITGAASSIASSNLGASKALVSDASGKVAVAAVTAVELAYLVGVTSGIQAQINAKQPTIVGAASTITDSNLTASRALVSDGSGKVAVAAVTAAELAYLVGVSSGIQAQINGKLATTGTAADSSKVGGKVITVGTTAPASPAVGDVWIDTN